MKLARYQANGFIPTGEVPARRKGLAATVTIVKGDVLHDDGNGLITNATVSFDSATFMGIAAAGCVGDSSSVYVEYYPFNPATQYSVPVAANAVLTQTAIGTNVDMEANDDIDISDVVTTGLGFKITDIDISAEAIAANTYGYAIGHLEKIVTES